MQQQLLKDKTFMHLNNSSNLTPLGNEALLMHSGVILSGEHYPGALVFFTARQALDGFGFFLLELHSCLTLWYSL